MRSDKHFSQTSLFLFFFFLFYLYFLFLILLFHCSFESSHESIGFVEEALTFCFAVCLSHLLFENVYLTSSSVRAHSGGNIIQGRRVIGRGFLLARSEAGITEFVEVHLNKILAVFGRTTLLLLALLTVL